MNNQAWYSQVISFCTRRLIAKSVRSTCSTTKTSNSSIQYTVLCQQGTLVALETWLAESREEASCRGTEHEDDNQWLKDLLKVQFHEDDDEDDFFSDEEFI